MKDYCCCAIPLVNTGIYLIFFVQFVFAAVAGILSVATPSIVGAVTPSFASLVLGVICFVGAAIQVLGAISVKLEKATLFRRYVLLHALVVVAVFAISATWIILSATRHNTAQNNCLRDYFPSDSVTGQGITLCNIFPWVSVGIMGGLWVILGIFFVYLWVVLSAYGRDQRVDHVQYDQLHDATDKRDPWDSRMSTEHLRHQTQYDPAYGHYRSQSATSMSDVVNQPHQHPQDSTKYNTRY